MFPSKFADQAQMLDQLARGYRTLAREIGATAIVPVGDAFSTAESSPRHYDLYAPNNNYHANDTGYILSALVFARILYGKLPTDLKPVLTDITPEDMTWLASIADSTVRTWEHASTPLTSAASP